MTTAFVSRFTPSLMSHQALEAIFVQREAFIGRLVALTRDSVLTSAKHYTLLIGPRGIGKTHLMALIYHRLTAMADLRENMRLAWLREEEWGVTSFLELLLRIFTALGEEYQDKALATQVQALYTLSPAEAQRQAAALLLEYCEQRTLVLLMENLDELFHELGDTGQQHFRAYLQEHPFCTIVATAQSLFNGVSRQKSPFYGFFRLRHLEELQLDEAVQLLTRIAQYEQQPALVAFLQHPRGRARVQALAHLAGGNHRVYVMLAQFLTRESLDDLVEPVLSMLDDLTPYYQSRLAWLSPQQRKLVNCLCEHRGALPVKEIAQHCFISQQTAANQLQKLSQMGYVRSAAAGRESFYELREPLLRMGMEVKKHRGQPIRLFVEFLRSWYTPGELEARVELLQSHTLLDREYLLAALQPTGVMSTGEPLAVSMSSGQGEKAFAISHEAMIRKSYVVQLPNHYEGTLSEESRHQDAIAVYDDLLQRFGDATTPALQERVARALVNKGEALAQLGHYGQALEACNMALAQNPAEAIAARACSQRVIALFALQQWDDALQALDETLTRFPQAYDQLDHTPAEVSLGLLLTGTEASLWPARLAALLTCYRQHQALAWLGQGLVRSIATLSSPMVSQRAAQAWRDLWQEHAGGDEALAIPLRLLDAAVRYRETQDRRVLLRLPMEERKVLEQVLEGRGATTPAQ